jgi:carboxyl-terminal processing protease
MHALKRALAIVVTVAPLMGLTAIVPQMSPSALARTGTDVPQADAKIFDEAWHTVRFRFYDRDFGGKDWDGAYDRHKPAYLAAKTPRERSAAINAMLAELGVSHTAHYADDDPAYYQLVDIFRHGLRREIPERFPGGKIHYPGIGIMTREFGGRVHVSGVLAGLPGAAAGLLVGDEIVSVDGAPFEPVRSFQGKAGGQVTMKVRRAEGGPETAVTIEPKTIEPGPAFEAAMRDSARVIERNGRRIGYIRVWSYAGGQYQRILVDALSSGTLKDADALIWDLRDGWGGADPEYLDLFNARGPDMIYTDRDRDTGFANFKWRKPVALLVNGGTRSGKEVLTYGFKKYGYGPVIGTRTAGALLAGRGFLLSDGSFLMVAVNDVSVDGERVEGRGVEPAIEVPFDIPYAAGRDPQLEKAIELLAGTS